MSFSMAMAFSYSNLRPLRRPRRRLHRLCRQVLAPTLSKGDIVSLDNLGSHKSKAAREAIRAVSAHLIFLPAYSPDLNPIEQVFAKLKHLMPKAAPRTVEATWRNLGDTLISSLRPSAPTISKTQAMIPYENSMLYM